MEYQMEELLPIVAMLARKYTSGESSSVTYETGQMLMEAVLYCIHEFDEYGAQDHTLVAAEISAKTAYQEGYKKVMERVGKAKEIYEQIIVDFSDYGCENYSGTLRGGMPEFFLRYDARFCPRNHILTLDYPVMFWDETQCGVDRIYHYLQAVSMEKKILDLFPETTIGELLQKIDKGYKKHYFGNICEPVLLNMVGCVIADRPLSGLLLDSEDYGEIEMYFRDDDKEGIEKKLTQIVGLILKNISGGTEMEAHFLPAVRGWAARIEAAGHQKMLHHIFL